MPAKRTESAAPRHFWAAVVLIVLVIIAVTGWRSLGNTPRTAMPTTSPVADLEPLLPFAAPAADTARVAALSPGTAPVFRDPFVAVPTLAAVQAGRPNEQPKPEDESLILSAVLITQSRRAAVINDVLVDLGGRIAGGPRLTAVERDHVVLTDANGVRRTLTLSDGHL
ncbi:MAG: hypothetical protein ACHQWU_14215 [Gemmatimonadales bacterium]